MKTAAAEPVPLFKWNGDESTRVILMPFRHPDLWAFRKMIEQNHWVAEEVDISGDSVHWRALTEEKKTPVKVSLGVFAVFDQAVLATLPGLSGAVDCMEARYYYAAQEDQECIHNEAYMLQITALGDEKTSSEILGLHEVDGPIRALFQWARDRMAVPDFHTRLVANIAVEGVAFSGLFPILQWFREKKLLNGIVGFNSFIARDEGIHCKFACHLVRSPYMLKKPDAKLVEQLFREAVAHMGAVIDAALPAPVEDLNAALVKKHMMFQADAVLKDMGYAPLFSREGAAPLEFMLKLDMSSVKKTDFLKTASLNYRGPSSGAAAFVYNPTPVELEADDT